MTLTPKQQLFVSEYLLDLNATQAAIRAGYSKKTAMQIGEQNLRKLEISEAIDQAKAERLERNKVEADWVLNRLVAEANADLAYLYDGNGALLPITE